MGRATKALAAAGLLAGLTACASGTTTDTGQFSGAMPTKAVAARPQPQRDPVRRREERTARGPSASEGGGAIEVAKAAKPTRAEVPVPDPRKPSPETLPEKVAAIEPAPTPQPTAAEATKAEAAATERTGSIPVGTRHGLQPSAKYRTRSAFPIMTRSSRRPRTRGAFPTSDNPRFRTFPIFWATNRGVEASGSVERAVTEDRILSRADGVKSYERVSFGSKRGDALTKGLALVTVPKIKREVGSIPRPQIFTLLGVTIRREVEDPGKHFTIRSLVRMDDADFLKLAAANLDEASNFKGHCFVYVHGYRNTFDDAIFRAAQVAVDMNFDGNAFVYSWPSQGNVAGYIADRDAVDASQPHFQKFLRFLSDETTCEQVHVMAHSMGTRLVVDAFFPPSGRGALHDLDNVGQIVLASPDIDASILRSRAEAIRQSPRTVTLYANGRDDALQWSKTAAAGYVRAGDVVDGKPLVIEGIDTIDLTPMSDATWVFIGANHNEYAERAHILQDIALLIKDGVRPPAKRFPIYAVQSLDGGKFWRYVTN